MLSTFTPSSGPKAGFTFTLPYVKDQYDVTLHFGSSIQNLPRGTGSWIPSGTAPMFPTSGEIDVTFLITPNWLRLLGYWVPGTNSSTAALETFIIAATQHLLMGGLGTLVDTPPTGTTHGIGGVAITSRTCSAIIAGDPNAARRSGGDSCEWQMTILVPSAQWTLSDASLVLLS